MKKLARGFTLLETLVASALLFMFLAGVLVILQILMRSVGEARLRLVASSLASERLETAKNLPYEVLGTVGGIPPGDLPQSETVTQNGQDFVVTTAVVYIDDGFDGVLPEDPIPNDYKRVRVTVTWAGVFQPKNPLVMATDVAPPGIESIANAGTLLIQVLDSAGLPVSTANVSIEASSLSPPIDLDTTSDADGRVMLPGAPECIECYRILVTKNAYSTDQTHVTAEVANPIKPQLSVFEGQLTQSSFAIDRFANLTVRATRSRQAGYATFPGVQFTLRGSKTIGTDTLANPVYKYQQNFITGGLGQVVLPNLEWDLYDLFLPTGSSIDIAGSVPLIPFPLLSGTSPTITIVTTANTANSLLFSVEDNADVLLPLASITLFDQSTPVATLSAGEAGKGDQGQAYFGGLSVQNYDFLVTLSGFTDATGSVTPVGDIYESIILSTP
ncbi:hypothetical protein A3B57_02795 [Microgenomates group bacterium RIFCSPLOWO2_01_FULL_47_10]|nr:MAG: hypothetical protein A3B57_02795 [Microgenomates group bacterium RIFCSPLOWO2_01_FULL_47_10]